MRSDSQFCFLKWIVMFPIVLAYITITFFHVFAWPVATYKCTVTTQAFWWMTKVEFCCSFPEASFKNGYWNQRNQNDFLQLTWFSLMSGNALCYYLDFLLVTDQRIDELHIAFSRVGLIADWLKNWLSHRPIFFLWYSEKHDSSRHSTIGTHVTDHTHVGAKLSNMTLVQTYLELVPRGNVYAEQKGWG